MRHLWAKWYVKAAAVVLGAFVSSILARSWAIHIFTEGKIGYHSSLFGRMLEPGTAVLLFTLAGGFVGLIIALVVFLGYSGFRRFSKKLWQWKRLAIVLAVVFAIVVVLWGTLFVWKATRHLDEGQVTALAEGVYARASSCKGSLVTRAKPPTIWVGETWRVTVAGPCGLKTFEVDDATGGVFSAPTPTPIPWPTPTPGPTPTPWPTPTLVPLPMPPFWPTPADFDMYAAIAEERRRWLIEHGATPEPTKWDRDAALAEAQRRWELEHPATPTPVGVR